MFVSHSYQINSSFPYCIRQKIFSKHDEKHLTSYWFKSFSGKSARKWLAFTMHFVPSCPNPGLIGKVKDLLELGNPMSDSRKLTDPLHKAGTVARPFSRMTGLFAAVHGLELGRIKASPWSNFRPPLPLLLPLFFDGGEDWFGSLLLWLWGSWTGGPLPFWAVFELFCGALMALCNWGFTTKCCSEFSFICLIGMTWVEEFDYST